MIETIRRKNRSNKNGSTNVNNVQSDNGDHRKSKSSPARENCILQTMEKTGWDRERASRAVSAARKKYPELKYKEYVKYGFYSLSPSEQESRYSKILKNKELRENCIRLTMEHKGCDRDEAKKVLDAARKKFPGLKYKHYSGYSFYALDEAGQEAAFAQIGEKAEKKQQRLEEKRQNSPNWEELISRATGWSMDETEDVLREVKENYGVSAKAFYKGRLYEKTPTSMAVHLLTVGRKNKKNRDIYDAIEDICGKQKWEVQDDLKYIRDMKPIIRVDLNWYFTSGIYELNLPDDIVKLEKKIQYTTWSRSLRDYIRSCFEQIDKGEMRYEKIDGLISEFYDVVETLLSEGKRRQLYGFISEVRPDLAEDREAFERVTLDMEATNQLLGFTGDEYASFYFWDKTIPQKREYISSVFRGQVIVSLNSPGSMDTLNNKYLAYTVLKKYYGREMALLDYKNGYETLKDFSKRHSVFVKKNNFDSLGRGVVKVDTSKYDSLKDVYDDIVKDGKLIILEELIKPSKFIKQLNPDSVNTIRVVTYMDGYEVNIQDTFMKIGRKGSFVDNGGAGGILVHIDKDTGKMFGFGQNEKGIRFDKHPDHGYTFDGIQLPDWDKALKVAEAAARSINGLVYAGWDLTYTSDNEWIIIEGNCRTQFIGQQFGDRPIKQRFMRDIDYKGIISRKVTERWEMEKEDDSYKYEQIPSEYCYFMEDKITEDLKRNYIEERSLSSLKYCPDIDNPKTFNEKMIWLALYYKNPNIAIAADKTKCKDFVASIVGEGHTIPTYGVYDHASEIVFDDLPKSFVVKLNDGWGASTVKVIRDKRIENEDLLRKELASWLYPWNNYYYRNMCITDQKMEKPALIIEQYMENEGHDALTDYKIYCFNGEPKLTLVVEDRGEILESRTFVDLDWNILTISRRGKKFLENPQRPESFETMLDLSRKLAKDFPFVRIDFYEVDGKPYVGEMTFTPGLFMRFTTKDMDYRLGELLDLQPYIDAKK